MNKFMGVDINGWHDWSARDWNPDEDEQAFKEYHLIDGGVGSVAIRRSPGNWLGGPRAVIAPHGRGKGWGDIGNPDYRCNISETIQNLITRDIPDDGLAFASTVKELSKGSNRIIVTVPDNADIREKTQGQILKALNHRGAPRAQILWRSIAFFLGALKNDLISDLRQGLIVTEILHDTDGFEKQTLKVSSTSSHPDHLIPERKTFGQIIHPDVGLKNLNDDLWSNIQSNNDLLNSGRIETSRLPIEFLCGDHHHPASEILRHNNAQWLLAEAHEPNLDVSTVESLVLDECDLVLFASPVDGKLRKKILATLAHLTTPLIEIPWSTGAIGALYAARLIEKGLPHYLETLEPISLAVLRNGIASFSPLIGNDQTVPAHKEFSADIVDEFIWPANINEIEFYIKKGEAEVRKWIISTDEAPDQNARIDINLRQVPGQSWAKLFISSSEWNYLKRNPIYLDWENLLPEDRSPEEILKGLQRPRPAVPNRIIEEAHIGFWNGNLTNSPVLDAIATNKADPLYNALTQQRRVPLNPDVDPPNSGPKYHPISTDGQLPTDLSADHQGHFRKVERNLLKTLEIRIQENTLQNNNRSFLSLSWTFTRCPEKVQEEIVAALEAHNAGTNHPYLSMPQARILQQAAGRTINRPSLLRKALLALVKRPSITQDTIGAISFITSRREHAPKALNDELIQEILKIVGERISKLTRERSYGTGLTYTLNTIVGLLRYREISPNEITTQSSKLVQAIYDKLAFLIVALKREPATRRSVYFKNLIEIMENLLSFLEGTGGDPNILIRIDQLDEQPE